jgi:hypothetical protein
LVLAAFIAARADTTVEFRVISFEALDKHLPYQCHSMKDALDLEVEASCSRMNDLLVDVGVAAAACKLVSLNVGGRPYYGMDIGDQVMIVPLGKYLRSDIILLVPIISECLPYSVPIPHTLQGYSLVRIS